MKLDKERKEKWDQFNAFEDVCRTVKNKLEGAIIASHTYSMDYDKRMTMYASLDRLKRYKKETKNEFFYITTDAIEKRTHLVRGLTPPQSYYTK